MQNKYKGSTLEEVESKYPFTHLHYFLKKIQMAKHKLQIYLHLFWKPAAWCNSHLLAHLEPVFKIIKMVSLSWRVYISYQTIPQVNMWISLFSLIWQPADRLFPRSWSGHMELPWSRTWKRRSWWHRRNKKTHWQAHQQRKGRQ